VQDFRAPALKGAFSGDGGGRIVGPGWGVMKRLAILLLGLAAAWPAWGAPPDAGDPEAVALSQEYSRLYRAETSFKAKEFAVALGLLKLAIADKAFAQVEAADQYVTYDYLAEAAYETKDYDTAGYAVRQACASDHATANDWYLRLRIDDARGDTDDEAVSVAGIAELSPSLLKELGDDFVAFALDEAARPSAGADARPRLLKALLHAGWAPSGAPAETADPLWLELARDAVTSGDSALAAAATDRITSPEAVTAVRIDARFDAATTPLRFDIMAAYARSLETWQGWARDHPDRLAAPFHAAYLLVLLDRAGEALPVIDEAIGRAAGDQPAFADQALYLDGMRDLRAAALMALGRADEAIVQYGAAARLAARDDMRTGAVLNLAVIYDNLAQPRYALTVLKDVDAAALPLRQRMSYEDLRACAEVQLRDAAAAEQSLAYLDAHAAEAPALALDALLCTGDIARTAAKTVALLADPAAVPATLEALQIRHKRKNLGTQPFARQMSARWDALRARPEVQAAVAKVGRVVPLPVAFYLY